ncbi:olfactory receptor 4F6-like [Astyanax mexicanus]|uniref:Olfactory receptor 4F6-like n=1 Tax=Astyanax mexicanus TaxID=7994 RepID=A0A8T2M3E2_ASTMX|nr:olfactory receptor 4F6-like [Astyanax mexicanus]
MNATTDQLSTPDNYQEAFAKNIVIVFLGLIIIFINGMFVFTFSRYPVFHNDPRYILYINLVINDIMMICISVTLYVLTYAWPYVNVSFCCVLITLGSTTYINTPLNLAGMAIERYIAVCKPLHHSQICTVQRTYILICVIWGVGAIPAIIDIIIVIALQPSSFFNSLTYCQPFIVFNTKYHIQKTIATQVLYLSVVWITLLYTYFRVLFTAKIASSGQYQSSVKKARNTILLHGGQLLLCMLSYLTPVLDMLLIPFFPTHRTKITFFNYLLTNILPRLLSPLIYGVRDQKFVKHMKGYFFCKVLISKVVPSSAKRQL